MRHFLALLFLAAGISWGQATPDCQFTVSFSSASPQSPAFNNKPTTAGGQTPCTSWIVTYWTNGASGVSLAIQGAPDSAGSPGSYTNLTAISSSANPATGTAEGNVLACCDYYPWIRINPTAFTGTSQTMIVRVYGYRNNNVARGSGTGGGGTIANTTNTLKGDGAGNAVAVTGTGTDCALVNGSSAPCGSSTGNAASLVAYTPGATVTLTCPSATAGTVTVFAPNAALSANMALSYASCTTGQILVVRVQQATSGTKYTVSGLPTGAPQISDFDATTTIYTLHATGATSVAFDNVAADSGPSVCTESAAPGTPSAGAVYIWCDSTAANLQVKNPAGAISGTAFAKTAASNQALLSFDPTTGLFTQGAISAAPSGTAGGVLAGTYPNPSFAPNPGFTRFTSSYTSSLTTTDLGLNLYMAATPGSAPSGSFTGGQMTLEYNSASDTANQIVGWKGIGSTTGAGRANQTMGIFGRATSASTAAGALTTSLYGGLFDCQNNGTGTLTHCVGIKIGTPVNAGTLTGNFGLYIQTQTPTGGGTSALSEAMHIEGIGVNNRIAWGNNDGAAHTQLYSSAADVLDVAATAGVNVTATSGDFKINQNSVTPFTSVASGAFADTLKLNAGNVQMLTGGLLQLGGGTSFGRITGTNHTFLRAVSGSGLAFLVNGGSQAALSNASFTMDSASNFNLTQGKGQHINPQAANSDLAGTITISNPGTSASVSFTTAYTNAPSCILTPTSNQIATVVTWWVTTSTSAVTANVATTPASSIVFNYLCLGNPN